MHKRRGFTLIELLVVMAIILIIMMILSRAFGDSLKALRRAKGVGDLQEKLRGADILIRRDLAADHFDGRRRVSDWTYAWGIGGDKSNIPVPRRIPRQDPVREGYFGVTAPIYNPSTDFEGTDANGVPSRIVKGQSLRFTVKLRGNEPHNYFAARLPDKSPLLGLSSTYIGLPGDARFQEQPTSSQGPNTYTSQWAEVTYSLGGSSNGGAAGRTQLFALYRSQHVLVADNTLFNGKIASGDGGYKEFSTSTGSNGMMHFNTPTDMATQTLGPLPNASGALILDDVISFEAVVFNRETWDYWGNPTGTGFLITPASKGGAGIPAHKPRDDDPYLYMRNRNPPDPKADYFVDYKDRTTWYNGVESKKGPFWMVPVDGIRITIRVWDRKTDQTRQITIIQDL